MNLIIYLIAGAIVGYIASRIMHTNSQQGTADRHRSGRHRRVHCWLLPQPTVGCRDDQ